MTRDSIQFFESFHYYRHKIFRLQSQKTLFFLDNDMRETEIIVHSQSIVFVELTPVERVRRNERKSI